MKYLAVGLLALLATAAQAQHGQTSRNSQNINSVPANAVGSLPACNAGRNGDIRNVTDANAPTVGATVAGGGAVTTLVHCNATNWIVG